MQNKPNFLESQMNVTSLITVDYENKSNWTLGKNKANTKPNKANLSQLKPIKCQNKANSNPIKPNFKSEGRSEKWNVSRSSSDLYYRIMQKSRDQIYNELLVLKCQQDSRDAFEELVERWQKRLWHYAFQLTGSDAAAWDVVQESWVGIIKGIRRLGDAAVFPRWAFRILNNKCADWLRKQQLQSRLNNELKRRTQSESDKDNKAGERTKSLWAAIEKLSPERRALLTLRYSEGFDIGQIAEILDVAEGTVKSRLHRTLEKLRRVMGQK